MDDTTRDLRMAYHEAGHALAALVFGRTLTRVSINPHPRRPLQAFTEWQRGPGGDEKSIRAQIVIFLAGRCAERHGVGAIDESESSGDYDDARELAERIDDIRFERGDCSDYDSHQCLKECEERAERLITECALAVDTIVNALLALREISGQHAHDLIADCLKQAQDA